MVKEERVLELSSAKENFKKTQEEASTWDPCLQVILSVH
jgi:hypothetical protein